MGRSLHPLALLVLAAFALAADDEIVREFQKYFRKLDDSASRIEAVLALEGTESAEVVKVLSPVLADPDEDVAEACVRVLGGFHEPASVRAVFARLDAESKELVRAGLLRAIARGRYAPPDEDAREALQEALGDSSWEVRRRAALALAAPGDRAVSPSLLPLVEDSEPAVRAAALDALAALGAAETVDAALASLDDPVWQVRASAIAALARVRAKRSVAPLIARLEVEEGRLVADLTEALAALTGRDFGSEVEQWKEFWQRWGDQFQLPSDEELAKLRAKRAENRARYAPGKSTNYHGIETPSRSILFVIDVSGSMENEVVEKDRFRDGGYPSFQRIDIVKTELERTIEGLESYVKFNIIAFATDTKSWKNTLVPANVLNKRSAIDWVGGLKPIGGTSKEGLARVGLVGSANLAAGKTNTYAALTAALGVKKGNKRRARDPRYAVDVDTIFFLSDGRPTTGEYVDPDDILREVRELNELRRVVIHTIAIGEFQKAFMQRLARENGGVFVDLGK